MNKLFLFETKIWFFLTEIPLVFLLKITLRYNEAIPELIEKLTENNQPILNASTLMTVRLYPLIVFLILGMLFIFLWFFRFVTVSYEEIRVHGLFSSKDAAVLADGCDLVLTLLPHGNLRLEVEGPNDTSDFHSLLGADKPARINLFRHRTLGGTATAKRMMKYFGVPAEKCDLFLSEETKMQNFETVCAWSDVENECRRVHLRIQVSES